MVVTCPWQSLLRLKTSYGSHWRARHSPKSLRRLNQLHLIQKARHSGPKSLKRQQTSLKRPKTSPKRHHPMQTKVMHSQRVGAVPGVLVAGITRARPLCSRRNEAPVRPKVVIAEVHGRETGTTSRMTKMARIALRNDPGLNDSLLDGLHVAPGGLARAVIVRGDAVGPGAAGPGGGHGGAAHGGAAHGGAVRDAVARGRPMGVTLELIGETLVEREERARAARAQGHAQERKLSPCRRPNHSKAAKVRSLPQVPKVRVWHRLLQSQPCPLGGHKLRWLQRCSSKC